MNITIIGASGGVGLETVKRGLNRKHSITTLSRSGIEIDDKKSLKIILGDATNKADLLNSGFGAGESKNYVSWFIKLFLKYLLKDVYADKTKMEEIITHSDLNWTVVRPGRLLDKELTEKYRVENKLFKGINIGGINRADVADFLIKQAENQTELKKYIGISEK
ncbi:MAG: NAD(P)-dependent oxidoreductase [Chitinophagia bacterium]|nr:NAD(P)-dependent oxidoreductase [Chitinophagia bacterium]